MFTFSVEKWQAWAPGMPDEASWREWARADDGASPDPQAGEPPKTAFLPPMQRRRLSPMARMVFECAWPLAEDMDAMPMVFASRHGETTRSYALLDDLAGDEPLSPTSFGLSVHNAIVGQWSIIRKETVEGVALAGDDDMLEHAFMEACALMRAGAPRVLVVIAEERPPAEYAAWIDDVPFSHATAFRLAAEGPDPWHVRLDAAFPSAASLAAADKTDAGHPVLPPALALIRRLIRGDQTWRRTGPVRNWLWSRAPS